MTFAAFEQAVRSRYKTLVADANNLPFVGSNEPFPEENVTKPWTALQIEYSDRRQVSCGPIGSRRFRTTGRVVVDLHCQARKGQNPFTDLLDNIRSNFESVELADPMVIFRGVVPGPRVVNGGWADQSVSWEFQLDEIL